MRNSLLYKGLRLRNFGYLFRGRFIPDRSYRENGSYTCCVRVFFFLLENGNFGLSEG